MKAKGSLILAVLLLGQIVAGVTMATASSFYLHQDRILPGTTINGVEVGKLTPGEALKKLKEKFPQPTPDSVLVLTDDEEGRWEISCRDIDLEYDYETAVQKAYQRGKNISPIKEIDKYYQLIKSKKDINLHLKFNESALVEVLKSIENNYNIEPKNAQVAYTGDKVVLLPETLGRKLDIDATVRYFKEVPAGRFSFQLVGKKIKPEMTSTDIKDINARLSLYVTSIDTGKKDGRVHNIKLASSKINNTVLQPGEIFSLNEAIGPRSRENGYKKAPVIVDDRLVDDYGGGVCQVATTLYNAVLKARLPVVERHRHTRPVSYAPMGRDAAIAGDIKDFKFKNDGEHAILISAKVYNDKLIISLLGNIDDAKSIKFKTETVREVIEPKIIYKFDTSLKPGEMKILRPGSEGYHIKTYEVTLVNGIEHERKLLSERHVKPQDTVILLSPYGPHKGIDK